ncbi:hypothetical protein GobsT_04110 [Gemmata obscuriglobus]|uniref:TolC family protein n=1 Tax=Gemmata obscuriglobus TaxID=114 RepID=A0A2Z3HBA5_9BACT|nr:hypothetical protein [Gemmata obscuriglobus]AWM40996.1 hypothetical protein C1280_31115 [Gemmata obscuriglobus]QEG25684.1 hypothetical protein GobsT_04110 [Gemmata obscuriglobus]VTR99325.1 Uncharacterized protein OS=Singulisphaera acidiphila (strain ATCC BAA-1392 / DSM 18658 / VKM B-2454 / MOB10) GN=Sinac_4921 PE=4 SV=1 [Gemmata obscuriglobus UQM 2246]
MRVVLGACALAFGVAAGCRAPAPAPPAFAPRATVAANAPELPLAAPDRVEPDVSRLARTPIKPISASAEIAYRRLTEPACQALAAQHTPAANALDEEGRAPAACERRTDELKRVLRFCAALELRNRSAADAAERFFQLAAVEGQTDFLREAFPRLDELLDKAKGARAANVRFPLDPADLERQRVQMLTQLEQAEAGSALLNIDLKRRLGQPAVSERLWPSGDFGIQTEVPHVEEEVTAALADRPELRGLRALHAGLIPDALPLAREHLRGTNPLLGSAPPPPRGLARLLRRSASAETLSELEVRRKQLADLIEARERAVADETRAAVVSLTAQARKVQLARDRLDLWAAQRTDAVKKREANQPGAELLEAQVTLEWLKARTEVVGEVMAWHTARVRLKAAKGWLAWECLGAGR